MRRAEQCHPCQQGSFNLIVTKCQKIPNHGTLCLASKLKIFQGHETPLDSSPCLTALLFFLELRKLLFLLILPCASPLTGVITNN